MSKQSRKMFLLGFLFVFLLSGCMGKEKAGENGQAGVATLGTTEVPVYTRESVRMQMAEGYYAPSSFSTETDFSREGAFYYVRSGDNLQSYSFYFQPYFSTEKPACLFEKEGGYMRDLSTVKREDGMHFCLLWVDEDVAHVSDYDEKGKLCREVTVEGQGLETAGKWPILRALADGGYLIGLDDKVHLVREDGTPEHTATIKDGQVRNLVETGDGRRFAVYQDLTKNQNGAAGVYGISVAQLDMDKNAVCATRILPCDDERISVFDDNRLVCSDSDFSWLFDMDETKDEKLIDLKKQNILASQIEGIYGTREEVIVVSRDPSEGENGTIVCRLTPKSEEDLAADGEDANNGKGDSSKRELYTDDGRKIVRIAVSNDESWETWYAGELEYWARKYSQSCDAAVFEVERFDGSLENYFGRGERPEIIVLKDQCAIEHLVELNALADFYPLYEKREKDSPDDILPMAREALSVDGRLYALTNFFQLLLYASDGTEKDVQGKCSSIDYLKWYDSYLNKNDVVGLPDLSMLFLGLMPDYYDEETGNVDFTSDEFKALMKEYKELKRKHPGEWTKYDAKYGLDLRILNRNCKGPVWVGYLLSESELIDVNSVLYGGPTLKSEYINMNYELSGVPTREGGTMTYMMLYHPMAIMSTSQCQEEALDFILYACKNKNRVGSSTAGGVPSIEVPDKSSANTMGRFWIFEEYLREEIWETEKYCWVIMLEKPIDGYTGLCYPITDECKEMLRGRMDSAVGITKAQSDIYGMFLEEMDGYLNGNKDLDSCCDILQNRVRLYLME